MYIFEWKNLNPLSFIWIELIFSLRWTNEPSYLFVHFHSSCCWINWSQFILFDNSFDLTKTITENESFVKNKNKNLNR